MTWIRVFLIVTGCALAGLVMGGLLGWVSGMITPGFFAHFIWSDVEPVGFTTFVGAAAGLLLGGALGGFGVIVQVIQNCRRRWLP